MPNTDPANRIAVILPAYNESATIAPTIEAFYAQLPDAEFIVVDNNSSDDTGAIAQSTIQRLGARGHVINEPRQGKGNAVRRAFLTIDADIYILADADLTYPAEQVHELIQPVAQGHADMVVGDRHSGGQYSSENKRLFHSFGNTLVQWLVNRLFGASLVDIMSGYRVFNRTFVKSYPILVEGFQVETDMTLHSLHRRMRIIEIPVAYRDRPVGSESKLNTFADGARVIFTIAQILRYYRPLIFFMTLSFIFAAAGFIAALPVFHDWITERYIHHVPLAVLAAAFEIVAFLLLAVALILDSITHHEKMRTELHQLDLEGNRTRQQP
ncbi:glycosyltransferase family 2 protein [Gilvimarinus polysaccharolyticus]|uniref:glycosyltransferase family 2 protein n=1 Tax=Gilvimarinus polysaccharolyticus TaxID=863921 RepID=UPI000673454E|nr:glycosyltransferase family 2 protein [Gilvimarinus polysaccharolyticus]